MEFAVPVAGSPPDLERIVEALRSIDPAALVDMDASAKVLRIAGVFDSALLASLLRNAGQAVARDDILQLPSICCGGCSG